jgi:diguanylate cyclase (GGDEF)-like protein
VVNAGRSSSGQDLSPVGIGVLVVDDDPAMLAAIQTCLDDAGLKVWTCGAPAGFWAALEEHQPDLVVLDFELRASAGCELCRLLRHDPRYRALPVLFLASTTSPDAVREMFDAGADDYVPKPFIGELLLARIFSRLERVALYRALADVDALTGASNRRKSMEDIERLLRIADRAQQPVCLVILGIDNFKAINDAHGHLSGDAVLRGVAGTLRRSLRADDVVARWHGDEFVIAMYGISAGDGRRRVGELLDVIRGARLGAGNEIRVTVSAGLAECPADGAELRSVYRAADEALYIAKRQGRDRVVHRGARSARP